MKQAIYAAALTAFGGLALSGCVESADPVLSGAQPLFGQRLDLQLYSLGNDVAKEPSRETFAWNGAVYIRSGGAHTLDAFSVHSFENGEYIVQSTPDKNPRKTEYALLHKLADGVYLARVIDEDDADEQTRATQCTKADKYTCHIETREQLLAFARATAARHHTNGGLVIRLPDEPEPKRKRPKQ